MPHMKAFGGNINIPASGGFVTGIRSDPGRTKSESPRLKQRRPVKTRPPLQTENTADRGAGSNARPTVMRPAARGLLGGPLSAVQAQAPARRGTAPRREVHQRGAAPRQAGA